MGSTMSALAESLIPLAECLEVSKDGLQVHSVEEVAEPQPAPEKEVKAMSALEVARQHIPVPQPWADCIEVPLPKHSGALRALAVPLMHHARIVQYAPALLALLMARPAKTVAGLAAYWGILSRLPIWQRAVQQAVAYGSSNRPRWMLASREPYDAKKKYMVTAHPHGMLCDGLFNAAARAEPDF